jgi:NADH:ubiquinone oxidoreductase subunit 6 (subunit J)
MKTTLAAVSAFTLLACGWLCVMFFVLRHPGFEWRAALLALVVIQSAATLVLLAAGSFTGRPRIILAIGACGLLTLGVSAFVANEAASDWEGYAAVISIALAVQAVLTLIACAYPDLTGRRSPPAPGSSTLRAPAGQ